MPNPTYTAHAHVEGGRDGGRGTTPGGELDVRLTLPKELGGEGDSGVNPEQLLAVGWAACFEAVLGIIGGEQARDVAIDSAVSLVKSGDGFVLAAALDVTLPAVTDQATAADLVRKSHEACPYSKATRGNVDVTFTVNGVALN